MANDRARGQKIGNKSGDKNYYFISTPNLFTLERFERLSTTTNDTDLPDEDDRELGEEPPPTLLARIKVDGRVAVVHDPAGHGRGDEGADGEREGADGHLVKLQLRGEPVVGLALPLVRLVAPEDVVGPL